MCAPLYKPLTFYLFLHYAYGSEYEELDITSQERLAGFATIGPDEQ
jgi:hypothetical protein